MSNQGYKSERLDYQLRFFVDLKKHRGRIAVERAVKAARAQFLKTGKSIAGVRIEVRWRNPDNRNPAHADWKSSDDPGQSLFDVWKTLGKGRGALH